MSFIYLIKAKFDFQHFLQVLQLILLKQKLKFPTYILQKINLGGGLPAVKDLNTSYPIFVVFGYWSVPNPAGLLNTNL